MLCEDKVLNTLHEPDQRLFQMGLRKLAQELVWGVVISSSKDTFL